MSFIFKELTFFKSWWGAYLYTDTHMTNGFKITNVRSYGSNVLGIG